MLIRPLNLKNDKGIRVSSCNDTPDIIKHAMFYLSNKLADKTDEEVLTYIKDKYKNGYMKEDIEELRSDVKTDKYFLYSEIVEELPTAISFVLDLLALQNNIVPKDKM